MNESDTKGRSMGTNGYSVSELSQLAGVSVRTLHHYDELGLVKAHRRANGYRAYDETAVERLHQVMLYRAAGMALADIAPLLEGGVPEQIEALSAHLEELCMQRRQLDEVIVNLERTIACLRGEESMGDSEKFSAFKRELIEENEAKYGKEAREKWGDEAVDASNANVMGLTEEQWERTRGVEAELREQLLAGLAKGDPWCEEAQRAAALHKEWLCVFWKKGTYSPQAHMGLAAGYVADERFKAYYDAWAPGAAEFLRDVIEVFCTK